MPRKFFKRILPDHAWIREHRHLKIFGTLHHHPSLWHLNRRSVAGAFAVGLFVAWIPLPFQMVIAAAAAILLRVNLPLSVVLVWISNPVTIPPLFYSAYKLGAWMLGVPPQPVEFQLSLSWFNQQLDSIWPPLTLGCLTAGTVSALLGWATIRLVWRWRIISQWRENRARRKKKALRKAGSNSPPPAEGCDSSARRDAGRGSPPRS